MGNSEDLTTDTMIAIQAGSFLSYLDKERNYSALTIKSYRKSLDDFVTFLQGYDSALLDAPTDIDRKTVRHFLGYLQERGLAPRTLARNLASLKSYFKFLIRNEIILASPAADILTPKFAKKLPDVLRTDQALQLMELPPDDTLAGLRDRAILELFYATGMRLAELTGISVGNVSFTRNTVRVLGKGNKERQLVFGEATSEALGRYLESRRRQGEQIEAGSPLFLGRGGKSISRRKIQLLVKHYLEQVSEGRRLSPHLLRHTMATHLVDRGAELNAVKDMLGHASLSTTQIYTHVSKERIIKVYKQAHPHAEPGQED